MSFTYPVSVFEKDDSSMRLISAENEILSQLQAVDIDNGEYVVWDARGHGVSIGVSVGAWKSKLKAVSSHTQVFPVHDAFVVYAETLGRQEPLADGEPVEVWRQIPRELELRKSGS